MLSIYFKKQWYVDFSQQYAFVTKIILDADKWSCVYIVH